ncbi:MAG TPA: sodium/solute symporter [Planctomycetota bacterium]
MILAPLLAVLLAVPLGAAAPPRAQVLAERPDAAGASAFLAQGDEPNSQVGHAFDWESLPSIPDHIGRGGLFAGTHGGVLLIAGGTNFPAGADKVWHDEIWALAPDGTEWIDAGRLPQALGYGASVGTPDGLVLVGGEDAEHAVTSVLRLRWDPAARKVSIDALPPLPQATTFLAGGLLGTELCVVGGRRSKRPEDLSVHTLILDLSAPAGERAWRAGTPFPGVARAKAAAAVQDDGFGPRLYLFGGEVAAPRAPDEGDGHRYRYRNDVWSFDVGRRNGRGHWQRRADMPRPAGAAAVAAYGQSHLLLFSGSVSAYENLPSEAVPDFVPGMLAYHTLTDTWVRAGNMPQGVATTVAVPWRGGIVIPSGETRPRVRTAQVQFAVPAPRESGFGALNWGVLGFYLAGLLLIGVFFARRERGTRDWFLAGQRIPWWAAGLSLYATQLSSITFLATPALAYATDWRVLPTMFMILAMAPIVTRCFLPFYRRLEVTTAYEYLEARFNLGVRLFGSASFLAYQLARMAIVVFLPALALSTVTGIDVVFCIVVMGALSTAYTWLGGMEAVVWTDVMQTVVLLGGMLLSLGLAIGGSGGPAAFFETAAAAGKTRALAGGLSFTELATWSVLVGSFFLQFGPYAADQAVVQRYMSTPDERSAARGIWLNGLISVPMGILFFVLGTALWAWFRTRPEALVVGMSNDEIFPLFVAERLPAGLAGLVIAGVFAASMSTLDSSLHSMATTVTVDWARRLRRSAGAADDRASLRLARWVTLLGGVVATSVALLLAGSDVRSLFLFFQKALGLTGSAVAAVFILGVFTRRAHGRGVLVGAAASVAAVAFATWATDLNFFLYGAVGIVTGVSVGYAASLILPAPARSIAGLSLRAPKAPAA